MKKSFDPSEMHFNIYMYFIQDYWLKTCDKNLLTEHDNGVVTTSAKTTNQCAISKTNMVNLSRITLMIKRGEAVSDQTMKPREVNI